MARTRVGQDWMETVGHTYAELNRHGVFQCVQRNNKPSILRLRFFKSHGLERYAARSKCLTSVWTSTRMWG